MKAVIMAGGTGTRLWPLSRDKQPKQFQAFVGNKTMLQHTYKRLSFMKKDDIFVATNSHYLPLIRKQLPQLKRTHIFQETAMRDTGASICNSAWQLSQAGHGDDVMAVIYADHLIKHTDAFQKALKCAISYAQKTQQLGVVGVRAQYPNTGLGYIKIGTQLTTQNNLDIYELAQFVEKPSLTKAKQFLHSYRYLWNTGLYVAPIKVLLNIYKTYSPAIYKAITQNNYDAAPKISFDYAVIEHLTPSQMFVIPADLGWNDIGNWGALFDELTQAKTDNLVEGNHLGIETNGSLILSSDKKKLIATYGLDNIIVVDTPDALLIMPKDQAGEVKKVVEQLKLKKMDRYL
ncbi:mannose-1-phosphate guanylyltransferase [Candidatus Gracilibacteria bacterium]|nr:mannose-1-phosphate guanylyltransferase [Candidatus Gracilibacteria bacterium]